MDISENHKKTRKIDKNAQKIDFNDGNWQPRIVNGQIVFDNISFMKSWKPYNREDAILELFSHGFEFDRAAEFVVKEKEFLNSLSKTQKDAYFEIWEMLQDYQTKREKSLLLYAKNF